jgi:hypothetical protein
MAACCQVTIDHKVAVLLSFAPVVAVQQPRRFFAVLAAGGTPSPVSPGRLHYCAAVLIKTPIATRRPRPRRMTEPTDSRTVAPYDGAMAALLRHADGLPALALLDLPCLISATTGAPSLEARAVAAACRARGLVVAAAAADEAQRRQLEQLLVGCEPRVLVRRGCRLHESAPRSDPRCDAAAATRHPLPLLPPTVADALRPTPTPTPRMQLLTPAAAGAEPGAAGRLVKSATGVACEEMLFFSSDSAALREAARLGMTTVRLGAQAGGGLGPAALERGLAAHESKLQDSRGY